MPALLVAVELTAVERRVARAEDAHAGIDEVPGERAVGHEGLEDRARRIHVRDGAVLKGPVRVLEQARPLRRRHAAHEPVRVVGGRGHERQDLARRGIHRDDGPDLVLEVLLRHVLQPHVEGEEEVLARRRLHAVGLGDLAPVGVDDHAALSVGARQQPLVAALHALLPDPVADGVQGSGALDLIGRCLREVAERVRRRPAVLVEPALRHRDRELGMLDRVGLHRRDLLDAQVLGDRDRKELGVPPAALHPGAHLARVELQQLDDESDRGLEVARLAPVQVQGVGRLVLHERRAVAVEDVAARRRDLDRAEAVVLGEREVVVPAHDLHGPVGDRQNRQDRADSHAGDLDAPQERLAVLADFQHVSRLAPSPRLTAASAAGAASTIPATGSSTPPREPLP